MFRTNGPAARSIGSDRGEQQQGKGKGKEADTSVPGEDEESLRSVQPVIAAGRKNRRIPSTVKCAAARSRASGATFNETLELSDSDENEHVEELLRCKTTPKKTNATQEREKAEAGPEIDQGEPDRERGSDGKNSPSGGNQKVAGTEGSVSDAREAEIVRLWRREVPLASSKPRQSWEPWPDQLALSRLLASKEKIFTLQRKAGLNRDLQLQAQFDTATRLAAHLRSGSLSSISNGGYIVSKFEAFCSANDIPVFPVTDAITLVHLASNTRDSKFKAATRKGRVTSFKNIFGGTAKLWAKDDAFLELSRYPDVDKALSEWIHFDAAPHNRSGGQLPATQSAAVNPVASSSSETQQEQVETQPTSTFPRAAVGYAGFTDAHVTHYNELQRFCNAGRCSAEDQMMLLQYIEVLRRHAIAHGSATSVVKPGINRGGRAPAARRASSEKAETKRSQSRPVSEPRRQVTTSRSPAPEDPPTKRIRRSSIGKRPPSPVPIPIDESKSSSKPQAPPKVESPPPPPDVSDPTASTSEDMINQPEPEEQAEGKSTALPPKPLLDPAQSRRPIIPCPAPSTSDSPQVPPQPRSRPARASLLAQTLLSFQKSDTQIPLSLASLRSFLKSLHPTLSFIAEPLHSSGLDTVEILGQFVAFEITTRVQMVLMACRDKNVEITEEHLEKLEAAIEQAREEDWD